MKQGYTHIAVLVDRSGSMAAIQSDAEGGLKSFIAEQRALPGELAVDLYQFDDEYEKVADIDKWTLQPRGTTALFDAAGRAVTDVGAILSEKAEADRPDKVVFVIVTDGMENSSKEWTQEQVKDLVRQQEEKYAWKFVFLAANMDATAEADKIGIYSAMNYDATGESVDAMYSTTSRSVAAYRSGVTLNVDLPEHVDDTYYPGSGAWS